MLWTGPALAQAPAAAPPATKLELRLADVARFAVFVDLTSVQWTGRTATLRLLQVTDPRPTRAAGMVWRRTQYRSAAAAACAAEVQQALSVDA